MNKTKTDKNFLFLTLAIGFFSALISLSLYLWSPDILKDIDLRYGDFRFRKRGVVKPNPQVAIIAIDEKSVNELGRWPWPRRRIAEIVEKAIDYKPRVLGFDIVFSESESEDADRVLGAALGKSKDVVLGYFFRDDATEAPPPESVKQIKRSNVKLVKFISEPEAEFLASFRSADLNVPEIGASSRWFGFFNALQDGDGLVRRAQLLIEYKGEIYPSLNLESIRRFAGGEILLTLASYGVEDLSLKKTRIPTDERGQFLINYYGPGGTFPTHSAVDVLSGALQKDALKDKLVFIGVTEKAMADFRPTPFDPHSYPGVEIHSTVAANVLDGRFLIKNSLTKALDMGLLLTFPLVLAFLLMKARRTLIGFAIFLGIVLLFLLWNYLLFSRFNLVTSSLFPVLSLGSVYVLFEGYRNLVIEKKSRYLRKAFSSYVSHDVVEEILREPDRLKLGGESRKVTLLFSDIRGFTSLSEKIPPETLVLLLNEYLSPMTQIVMEERGTLDKYIGDAVMAIFGAPLSVPDHAKRACHSALSMLTKLENLNTVWEQRGLPAISIGIGINTGEAIVGNMGSSMRFDYTAIGDTVNLASRLEGLNKLYGTNVIVSGSTLEHLDSSGGDFLLRELDFVRVKGKGEPVSIFELIGFSQEGSENLELIRLFAKALGLYRRRKFVEAREKFGEVLNAFPKDEPSSLYHERCSYYVLEPPSSDWDGVYVVKEK